MEIKIMGTYREMLQLPVPFDLLLEMIRVDPFRICMIPDTEIFTLTEADFKRVGILKE